MKALSLCVALLAATAAPSAFAQEVVGTAVVGGRTVQLLSDNTWRYADAVSRNCVSVEGRVSFCGLNQGWRRSENASTDTDASFQLNDRTYGLFVVEGIGADDGLSQEGMRSAVLGNAARATAGDAKDIPVLGISPTTVDGLSAETIAYSVVSDGLSFIFLNTINIEKKSTAQVITYHLGKALTGEMEGVHRRFLDATRLK